MLKSKKIFVHKMTTMPHKCTVVAAGMIMLWTGGLVMYCNHRIQKTFQSQTQNNKSEINSLHQKSNGNAALVIEAVTSLLENLGAKLSPQFLEITEKIKTLERSVNERSEETKQFIEACHEKKIIEIITTLTGDSTRVPHEQSIEDPALQQLYQYLYKTVILKYPIFLGKKAYDQCVAWVSENDITVGFETSNDFYDWLESIDFHKIKVSGTNYNYFTHKSNTQ